VIEAVGRVSPRRATDFSLLRQRKVSKRKATLLWASLRFATGNLRCSLFVGSTRNSLRSNTRGLDPRKAPLLGTHRRECSGLRCARPTEYQQPTQHKDAPRRVLPWLWYWYSCGGPLCACRGAQLQADKGCACLSAASFARTPPEASTAGCPKRSAGTRTVGPPFFCLLFFGETKKSESPAGARPGPQPHQSQRTRPQK
jgi:hypothetical protein